MIFILLMNLCFAAALPLLKQAVIYGSPLLVVAIRMILGGGMVLGIGKISGEVIKPIRSCHWKLLCATSIIAIYAVCVGEAIALEYMSATRASLIWALLPCATAGIGWMGYGQRLCVSQVIGIMGGTGGMVLLTIGSAGSENVGIWGISGADVLMLGAVISAGWAYFLIKQLLDEGHGLFFGNAITMIGGGLLSFGTWLGLGQSFQSLQWVPFLRYTLLVVLLVNMVGLTVQSFLITRYPVALLALSSSITPLLSIMMSVCLFGEMWHTEYTIASLCIAGGLILFYYEELQRMYKGVYA